MGKYLVAVDVGTGSARAGVFDAQGRILGRSSVPIAMKASGGRFAEHDSEDIWSAVCRAVKGARDEAGIAPADVAAIGFDATCSLVARDAEGRPLSVAQNGESGWDTIAWLDHRAIEEAGELSRIGGEAVRHSGGTISPEMQLPKLMWLKRRLPEVWIRAGMMFDLADFLTWRATGSLTRSICTLTAKWNYLAHTQEGWNQEELARAGLDDLGARAGISEIPAPIGISLGPLTASAADELGLTTAAVSTPGMVDAYAGQLALVGHDPAARGQVGLIGGTSSCLMRFSREPHHLESFWGPYRDVILPGWWVVEGGQSATGALLDYIVRTHGNGLEPTPGTHELILDRITQLVAEHGENFGAQIRILRRRRHHRHHPWPDVGRHVRRHVRGLLSRHGVAGARHPPDPRSHGIRRAGRHAPSRRRACAQRSARAALCRRHPVAGGDLGRRGSDAARHGNGRRGGCRPAPFARRGLQGNGPAGNHHCAERDPRPGARPGLPHLPQDAGTAPRARCAGLTA
jgi:FGGY-family pentulose kinase